MTIPSDQLPATAAALDDRRGISLAGRPGVPFTLAPKTMGELIEFAKLMSISGFCVRPQFRGNTGACLAVALQAFKCGGDPFAFSNKAYVTRNKAGEEQIAYEAQLVHSIVNTSGVLARRLRPTYAGDGQARICTITGWLKGEQEPLEYESPPLGKIAIKNSPLWTGDPDQQLFYYSTRAWARRHVPEVLLGIYTPDELQHGEIIDMDAPPPPRIEDYEPDPGPEPEESAFTVIDCDHGKHYFHSLERAEEALQAVIYEADRRGRDASAAAYENNRALIEECMIDPQPRGPAPNTMYNPLQEAIAKHGPPGYIKITDPTPAEAVDPEPTPAEPAQRGVEAARSSSEAKAGPTSGGRRDPRGRGPAPHPDPALAHAAPEAPREPPPGASPPPAAPEGHLRPLEIAMPLRRGQPDLSTWWYLFRIRARKIETQADFKKLLDGNVRHLTEYEASLSQESCMAAEAEIAAMLAALPE